MTSTEVRGKARKNMDFQRYIDKKVMQRETYKSDDNSKTNCRTLNKHVHPRSVRYCKKGLCAVSVYITTIQPQTQPHGVIRERVERRAVLFLPLHRAAWPDRERAVSSQTTSARVP